MLASRIESATRSAACRRQEREFNRGGRRDTPQNDQDHSVSAYICALRVDLLKTRQDSGFNGCVTADGEG